MRMVAMRAAGARRNVLAIAFVLMTLLFFVGCSGPSQPNAQPDAQPQSGSEAGDAGTETHPSDATGEQETAGITLISAQDANALLTAGQCAIIDIRAQSAYLALHAVGSVNIPVGTLKVRIREVPTDTTIVLVSKGEERLEQAAKTLEEAGIPADRIRAVEGGFEAWEAAGLPTEVSPDIGC